MKKGKITKQIGATPEKHELRTADIFALNGFDVEFLRPIAGCKMPESKALVSIIKYAKELKNVKKVKVVGKTREIIDIK